MTEPANQASVGKTEVDRALPNDLNVRENQTATAVAEPTEHQGAENGHDPEVLKRINSWLDEAASELDALVARVLADQLPTLNSIEASLDGFLEMFKKDSTAIAYCVIHGEQDADKAHEPSRRCVNMTALVGVVAQSYGLSREDCWSTCLAAMLHDLALFPGILEKIQDAFESEDERQSVVVRHGFFTSDLLSARTGLADLVRMVMQQVHEQMDGTGYPRGIPGRVTNVMARLINLVDAFVTLTSGGNCGSGFVPADAIAYLVHHTSRGAFDREAMMAFIRVQTMYGIGSRVMLDDGREATVLRGVDNHPLRPVVRLANVQADEEQTVIDLSQTQLNIVKPIEDQRFAYRTRMTKSQMQAVLWQQYNSLSASVVSLF